jgi:ketosteroid isomerase-like protein
MTDPIETVSTFLRLVEARDLEAAAPYLADGVVITFPGSRTFSGLDEQVAASKGRYARVAKVFERFDVSADGEDTIVYVFGTLEGESTGGTPFSGIRFIDRFVLRDGLIVDQKVWNDMGESGVLGS